MPSSLRKDEIESNPLALLARYRELCEASGAAAVAGIPLPRASREELTRLEGELQARLWLAGPGTPTPAARPTARERAVRSPSASPSSAAANGESAVPAVAAGGAMVYCDGACIGNPGPGGYGALVRVPGHPERTLSAGKGRTTNNEMEMAAAIAGLKLAISLGAAEITVVSDSEYLVKGMSSWLRGWLRNGWKTRAGDPVKNRALWEELHDLCRGRSVTWSWTRGHDGQPENERCDALAVAAAEEAARGQPRASR